MEPRLSYVTIAPEAYKRMLHLNAYLASCSLEQSLIHLVKLRASQLNGCASCLDMHWREAQAHGESEQRLYLLSAWREAPCYTERERAALAWTEACTLLASGPPSDELYAEVSRQLSERELVDLGFAIVIINGWNRLAVPFRSVPPLAQARGETH